MIPGTVSAEHEPTITVKVRGPGGVEHAFDALIDTGFAGTLTLPQSLIARLGLPWRDRGEITLADGGTCEFDVYNGFVVRDGRVAPVYVDSADVDPLPRSSSSPATG